MESKQNNGTNKNYIAICIYTAYLITTNLFAFATLLLIIVLGAERFAAVYFHLT